MADNKGFPSQIKSFSSKNKSWRKACVDWADNKLSTNYNYIRTSIRHKQINYDLLNGKIHMSDLQALMNPEGIRAEFIPDKIAHYPIMLSKINVLRGEEAKRVFDYRVVVTNPTAISEIEDNKRKELLQQLQQWVQSEGTEQESSEWLDSINDHFTYSWQDEKEIRANAVLTHYSKEYNMPMMFNIGFVDAMTVAEEIYQCDIVGGEPVVEKVDPKTIEILRSGFSNKVEDADMIIMTNYWNPGKVIDTYGEVLSPKDIKYLEECFTGHGNNDELSNVDERKGFIDRRMLSEEFIPTSPLDFPETLIGYSSADSYAPFDSLGNVKVTRVYWKSLRKIQKVKSYDPETGEETFDFYTEEYVPDKSKGEESDSYYINEAWEGTKIGEDIYVNMRPRVIQYNRLENPSRCHFGIVGTVYNMNTEKSYSLVDMMKQYNYLYDVIHDRLNRLIARNWGKLVRLDASKKPSKWTVDKWLYYAKQMGLVIEDSFNAGTEGYATGKLAGAMNSASTGVIDAELGNTIQQYTNLLEFIKLEMSEVCGITRQREGQISNRETVGGVERATLQSSHITEWLFTLHEDLKKRVYEVFLETAKIAMRGKKGLKFKYILPDTSVKIIEIDGDEFAEADYGLVVDSSQHMQEFASKLDMYAQAAMQNGLTSFSTIFKLYGTASLAEKMRIVEKDERDIQQRSQEAQQQELQARQQAEETKMQLEQQKLALQDQMNQRDNETRLMIASMSQSEDDGIQEPEYSQEAKDKLMETMREFDARITLDRERLELDKKKQASDARLKEKQINSKSAIKK